MNPSHILCGFLWPRPIKQIIHDWKTKSTSVAGHWQYNQWGWRAITVFPWPWGCLGKGFQHHLWCYPSSYPSLMGILVCSTGFRRYLAETQKAMPDFILCQLFPIVASHWIQLRQKWNEVFLSIYISLQSTTGHTQRYNKNAWQGPQLKSSIQNNRKRISIWAVFSTWEKLAEKLSCIFLHT